MLFIEKELNHYSRGIILKFFAINNKYSAKLPVDSGQDMIRKFLGKNPELVKILALFDGVLEEFGPKTPRDLLLSFRFSYMSMLNNFIRKPGGDTDILADMLSDLRSLEAVIEKLTATIPAEDVQMLRADLMVPMNLLRAQSRAAGVDTEDAPDEEEPAAEAPAGKVPTEGPAVETTEGPTVETTESGQISAIRKVARDSITQVKSTGAELFKALGPSLSALINDGSGFNQKKYETLFTNFVVSLISGINDNDFQRYYNGYGEGPEAMQSQVSGVTQDFRDIGIAFSYNLFDNACVATLGGMEKDAPHHQDLSSRQKEFAKDEDFNWSKVAKNTNADNLLGIARSISDNMVSINFVTGKQNQQKKRQGNNHNLKLFTEKGYAELYKKFIEIMRGLSGFGPWQSMLSMYSTPGTIEDGALDKLSGVLGQAKIAAQSGDNEANMFLKNFKSNENLTALNAIANAQFDAGCETYRKDDNPNQFVNFLAKYIEAATGGLSKGGVTHELRPGGYDSEKLNNPNELMNEPIVLSTPKGGSGPGASAYALGATLLVIYSSKFTPSVAPDDEELLQLNSPDEENIQLNLGNITDTDTGGNAPQAPAVAQGEQPLQLNQPAAPKAPAVSGGA